jgi:hypothetical protein
MAFKVLFLSHAPDADYKKHYSTIDTGKYRLISVVIKNQNEAIKVSKSFYESEKIDSVILCPGFTHNDVAEIFETLGGRVSVSVSRGDGLSSKIAREVIQREYFDKQNEV